MVRKLILPMSLSAIGGFLLPFVTGFFISPTVAIMFPYGSGVFGFVIALLWSKKFQVTMEFIFASLLVLSGALGWFLYLTCIINP
jgi:hypothetical protein